MKIRNNVLFIFSLLIINAGNQSQMDKIDLAILSALQNNARISNVKLATAVGLSPSASLLTFEVVVEDHQVAVAGVDSPQHGGQVWHGIGSHGIQADERAQSRLSDAWLVSVCVACIDSVREVR